MAKKNKKNNSEETHFELNLHPDIKKSVWIVVFFALTVIFLLAAAGQAGPLGEQFYTLFEKLFGIGYYLLPITSFLIAFSFFSPERKQLLWLTFVSGGLFVLASLGFIDIISPGSGGLTGVAMGSLRYPFGTPASLVITFSILAASFLVTINKPLALPIFRRNEEREEKKMMKDAMTIKLPSEPLPQAPIVDEIKKPQKDDHKKEMAVDAKGFEPITPQDQKPIRNYVPPPLSLLVSSIEKPTIGDLHANANIIKRTLESFGISVEMGEINVGPTVTRYTLKPAEGVKLSRITVLGQDLSLALAAHPIRIEAPIPGKSLVGIEVPNKAAAVVRLGSLLLYPEFQKSEGLSFMLGRNVNGDPVMPDITKMPHMLIAGATGSGKSITIHSIIISLLYRNSPDMLRMIMIDPKRVELSVYDNIPHLIAPVVKENKKAMGALRWAIEEMDRRYQLLLEAGSRDIKSFNKSSKEPLPFILIVIDELADLMSTYGREVEAAIIRLAQMARATGIHMIVSTQRPSVEVITGLIKANITTRIALQVASQIDSRTILDSAGAEKLLGHGDLLFVSADKSKPTRIQGSFITEEEIKKVSTFILKNNDIAEGLISLGAQTNGESGDEDSGPLPLSFDNYEASGDDDELYEEAVEVVRSAQKASASLLQRRLKVGYARAARLIDMMEERGVVGKGEGAKPRDILL